MPSTTKKKSTKKTSSKKAPSKEDKIEKAIEKKIENKIKSCFSNDESCKTEKKCASSTSAVYCLGFIGAAIYFISTSTGFWSGVLGVLKAIIWPVFLVYKALQFLGA